ncbi:angiopoietin-1-like [Drosophila subpulchrella]|uniref:angiopoietin-1-like n=1 Tax=Drosophila subpulchrella TaxID=1486046 RepID=UPI0018A15A1D|nr:angiopoietin-1-like [Drosophila subpulchrella]
MKWTFIIFLSVLLFKLILFGGADADEVTNLTETGTEEDDSFDYEKFKQASLITTEAIHNLLSNIKVLEELIRDRENTINIMSEQMKEKQEELRIAQDQIENKDAKISDQNKQLNDQLMNIVNQKQILENTEVEVNKMNETIQALLNQINDNNNFNNARKKEIESQNVLNQAQAKKINTLTKNIQELKDIIEIQNSEINAKRKEIESLKKRISDLMEENEAENDEKTWITIQKRFDGSENFDRNWTDYKKGFGDAKGEFFIGLDIIHAMTHSRQHELLIKLKTKNGTTYYAHYDNFQIGNEEQSYELKSLGKYSGTAGDSFSLTGPLPLKFSTSDKNNKRCSKTHGGGWWYYKCSNNMLNGKFYKSGRRSLGEVYGIHWGTLQNHDWLISLPFSEMMIRPKGA